MRYARLKAALGLTFLAVLGTLAAEPGHDDKSPVIAVSERTAGTPAKGRPSLGGLLPQPQPGAARGGQVAPVVYRLRP